MKYRTVANHDIDEEIVPLSREDHIKAHELLTHCTTGPLQEKMLAAYTYMTAPKQQAEKPTMPKQQIEKLAPKKPAQKKSAPKKSMKKYASKAEWPSTIKHNTNKAINEIAKKLWYADRTRSWEDCKAEATIIYEQQSTN